MFKLSKKSVEFILRTTSFSEGALAFKHATKLVEREREGGREGENERERNLIPGDSVIYLVEKGKDLS